MRIRIRTLHITFMRIRILPFTLMPFQIRILASRLRLKVLKKWPNRLIFHTFCHVICKLMRIRIRFLQFSLKRIRFHNSVVMVVLLPYPFISGQGYCVTICLFSSRSNILFFSSPLHDASPLSSLPSKDTVLFETVFVAKLSGADRNLLICGWISRHCIGCKFTRKSCHGKRKQK